jgi:hypothetical protein
VAPLDIIDDIIQTYHWGYLYNCACIVLPGWGENFMGTWRWYRMMTVALFFSLLFRGIFFKLIHTLSAGLLVYLCFPYQQIPSSRFLEPPTLE